VEVVIAYSPPGGHAFMTDVGIAYCPPGGHAFMPDVVVAYSAPFGHVFMPVPVRSPPVPGGGAPTGPPGVYADPMLGANGSAAGIAVPIGAAAGFSGGRAAASRDADGVTFAAVNCPSRDTGSPVTPTNPAAPVFPEIGRGVLGDHAVDKVVPVVPVVLPIVLIGSC